jgi:hypothetical protein
MSGSPAPPAAIPAAPAVRRRPSALDLADEGASFLPPPLRAGIVTATEAVRRLGALRRLRWRVRRLTGPTHGGRPLTAVLAMDDASARWWRRTLFVAEPDETRLPDLAALRVPAAAGALAAGADLVLGRLPWPLGRLVGGETVVPSHVPLWLATDRPLEAIVQGGPAGRGSRRDDLRRVRRLGAATTVTHDPAAHAWFARHLYGPYVRRRFGDLCLAIPEAAFRHARRQGALLLLAPLGGEPFAGALLERWATGLRILAFGTRVDGAVAPGLALAACYVAAIEFAVERGFPRLSLGNVRPVLTDGVLRYKRKWGGVVGRPTTWDAFLLRHRGTPAVRAALTAAPLVVRRGGRLVGLAGAEGLAPAAQREALATPGLAALEVLEGGPA